jgi:2-keto-4-pentenoate hydratase
MLKAHPQCQANAWRFYVRRGSKIRTGRQTLAVGAGEVAPVRAWTGCVVQLHPASTQTIYFGREALSAPSLQAATLLLDQRLSLEPITDLPLALRPQTEAEGYGLQRVLNGLLTIAGMGRQSGHKIGCTTAVMQKFLNVPNPCAGVVFEKTVLRGAARVPRSGFVKLGIECEIAVELARDLAPTGAPVDRDAAAGAIGAVMAAIELVDERYKDFRTLGVPTLIADDFFDSGCVLGNPVRDWRKLDLAGLSGVTYLNGVESGRGTGALVMGHPLEALAWLANARARHGLDTLKAGEFVLLGSVVETNWLNAGDAVRIEIEELGELSLEVT